MYFDVQERWLSDHRVHPFRCVVKDNTGKVVFKKNFQDYYEAWDWGYEKVKLVRR